MPTTIDSAGIIFNDASTITSANTFIAKPASPSNGQILGYDGSTWIAQNPSIAPTSAKAWVNFNGASAFYTSGNTVTYVANSPSAGQTTVTVDRTATWSPLPIVGDWVTVSGVTGATAVNGTFQITEVDNVAFNIKYIVPSVVTGTVGGTAVAYIVAIRSSYNVTSVTKNGTGNYTVNFATPMANANYSYSFGSKSTQTDDTVFPPCPSQWLNDVTSTTQFQFRGNRANSSLVDYPVLCLQIFGN
jgi:hypothetical protein